LRASPIEQKGVENSRAAFGGRRTPLNRQRRVLGASGEAKTSPTESFRFSRHYRLKAGRMGFSIPESARLVLDELRVKVAFGPA
jgi:hypothetical protein